MEKTLSTRQYADKRKISVQAVNQAIKLGHRLPGVKRKVKKGRFWKLHVDFQKI